MMLIICVNIAFDVAWFIGLLLHIKATNHKNYFNLDYHYLRQIQEVPVKSNIVAYSDNSKQRFPMDCILN